MADTARQVILLMTDTQRTDYLGCYGNEDMKTPNLDRLAEEGMLFNSAYCCQPVCGPARAAIFTGTYPHSNGSWANSMPLDQLSRTIGQRMQKNGFHTAYIGKYHLDGGDYFGYGECPEGWDPEYWYDMRCYLEELTLNERVRSRKHSTIYDQDFNKEFTYGHRCASKAIDFLENHHDQDFLLIISFDEPHGPALCPPEYKELYADYNLPKKDSFYDLLEDKPEHQQIWAGDAVDKNREKLKINNTATLGCNSFVDYEIGRVLKAVDKFAPEALTIYTADHGEAKGEHCLHSKGPAMYDEITRIPFLIRWPGVVKPNSIYQDPVSHIDIVPTILNAANLNQPALLTGKSLLPVLKSKNVKINQEIFLEFGRYEIDHDGFGGFQPVRAVFDGRYKLIINLLTSDELYDLKVDPVEMNNLIIDEDYREIRNELHDRLLEWMNNTRDPFRGYYWERRPWREDARLPTWDYTKMTRQRQPDEGEKRQLDYDTGLPMKEAVRKKK